MKQTEIIQILKAETKAKDLNGINKVLKSKDFTTKFRLTGPGFVHFGFTGMIKALTEDGVKIYNTNRVNLVRYEDIETFAKAIPREERKGIPAAALENKKSEAKPAAKTPAPKKKVMAPVEEDEDEDYENDDDFDPYADEDDDVIEDDSFAMKFENAKKAKKAANKDQDEEEDQSPKAKKKRLHQKGTGSLFIPKKK